VEVVDFLIDDIPRFGAKLFLFLSICFRIAFLDFGKEAKENKSASTVGFIDLFSFFELIANCFSFDGGMVVDEVSKV